MRVLGAGLWVVLAAVTASACGGSTSVIGSQTAVAPPVARATAATPPSRTTAPAPALTRLERDLAQSLRIAFLTQPPPPTQNQSPPIVDLFSRDPQTVCERLRPAAYRCAITYQTRSDARLRHVSYAVRRQHGCFTATAAAIAAASRLHRLSGC